MSTKNELLGKISFKTVCGKINRRKLPEDGTAMHVMRILGVANKIVTGNGDNGAFVGFLGSFEATNVETGEVFRSGKLFLPNVASNLLEAAVANNGGANVEFAFDIGVKEDDTSAVGYVYTASPIMEASENDPIALMKTRLIVPALPAPKGAAQPALPGTDPAKATGETDPAANAGAETDPAKATGSKNKK